MPSLNGGLRLKSKLSSLRALINHLTVILLLLAEHCGGQSDVIGPSQPIVALVGDDVILPCHLEPAENADSKTVEWGRLDLDPRFVHVWHQGNNFLEEQNPSYQGRTSLSTENLKHGDLSLNLSAVTPSDNGEYRCYLTSQGKAATAKLIVGSVSSPVVAEININSSTVDLTCESKGWYPEPELLWLDAEGKLLSAGPTETVRGPDVIYTVSSRVTVEKRHSNSFTCRVQQKITNQIRDAQIQVEAECHSGSCSSARLSTILVIIFALICAASFIIWRRSQKIALEKEWQQEDREKEDREQRLAERKKMEDLEKEKTKLDQELKKREKQQKDLEQVDKTVLEQEKELHKLCLEIKRTKDEMMKEKDDMNKELLSVDKQTGSEKANGYMKLHTIILNTKKYLEQVQEAQDLLYDDTVKLLKKAEDVLKTLTDNETEEEKHKEKIIEKLKQVEEQTAEPEDASRLGVFCYIMEVDQHTVAKMTHE